MRKTVFLFCLVFIFATTGVIFAQSKRTAVLEGSAGVTSEVTELIFSGSLSRFDHVTNRIAVITPIFDVAILIDSLISIETKEKSVNVRYQWRGQERTITGKPQGGVFKGKSDFGDIELSINKLRKLTFKEPTVPTTEKEMVSFDATLILTDGTKVPVANLKRYDTYYSSSRFGLGGSTIHAKYSDFRFLRGESLATVAFKEIKNITFQSYNNVTVTLKNGKKAMGTLSTEARARVKGFTGIYEKGEFFISPSHVKAIEFGITQE